MPGPTRQPTPRQPTGDGTASRDATIESLLLTGLDFYFGGQYERAIHAWTRVLFFDRGHARARAYIDRARRVLAERQREVDELLHGGLAAFDRGDVEQARRLLTPLAQGGSADDVALAVLHRLDRLEAPSCGVAPEPEVAAAPGTVPAADSPAPPHSRVNRILAAAAGVCLLGAAVLVLGWDRFTPGRPDREPPRPLDTSVAIVEADALPLPSVSELAIARARGLFSRGHLHEALRSLEAIRHEDPRRPDADRLRAEIQRALLASLDPRADPSALRTPSPHIAQP